MSWWNTRMAWAILLKNLQETVNIMLHRKKRGLKSHIQTVRSDILLPSWWRRKKSSTSKKNQRRFMSHSTKDTTFSKHEAWIKHEWPLTTQGQRGGCWRRVMSLWARKTPVRAWSRNTDECTGSTAVKQERIHEAEERFWEGTASEVDRKLAKVNQHCCYLHTLTLHPSNIKRCPSICSIL